MVSALELAMNRALSQADDLKAIASPDAKISKARLGLPAVVRTAIMGPPPSPNRDPHPYVGMLNYQGILIYIENEPGSIRAGIDSNGQPWRIKMTHMYGEIPGTSGADGDPVDVYIGPNPSSEVAYVIHQETHIGHEHAIEGTYDEDKVMLGFSTRDEALRAYADHFSYPVMAPGVTPIEVDELRRRVEEGELEYGSAVVKARGHKYISKRKVGGKWVYKYREDKKKPKKPKPTLTKKKRKPGSQLTAAQRKKLSDLGVTKLPQADIPLSDITVKLSPRGIHTRAVLSWRDAGGRRQNGYTPEFHKRNAAEKWKRILLFRKRVPGLKRKFAKILNTAEPGSQEHQAATIAAIIAATGLRPGNEASVSAGAIGVSTLSADHVTITGSRIDFEFVGKGNKMNYSFVKNRTLAKALKAYIDANPGRLFDAPSLPAARTLLPKGMKLKDFRTIRGTEEAIKALDSTLKPPPLTGDKKKDRRLLLKAIKAASSKVARALNNTTAVARHSYIHPMVFEQWAQEKAGAAPSLWKE